MARRNGPAPKRVAAFGLRITTESRAAAWLIAHGYRILARRWKSSLDEIDFIAGRRHTLIFVEVKARAKLDDDAESAILVVPSRLPRISQPRSKRIDEHDPKK